MDNSIAMLISSVVPFLFISIGFIWTSKGLIALRCGDDSCKHLLPIGIVSIFGGVMLCVVMTIVAENDIKTKFDTAVEDGYTVYVDGTEVNPDGIEIKRYNMNIDHDKHVVQLSVKQYTRTRHIYVPIVHR